MRGTRVGLAIAASVLVAGVGAAQDETFDGRLKEATRNQKSAGGKKYDESFSKEFGAHYALRLSECLKQTGESAPADFEMLLKLAGDGKVEEAMVRPETKVATCFRDLTKRAHYPAPPSAGYWHPVGMRFTKK